MDTINNGNIIQTYNKQGTNKQLKYTWNWPGESGVECPHVVRVQKSFLQNALVSLSSLSDPRGALKSVCLEPRVLSSTAIQAPKVCGSNLFKVHEFEIWKLNFHCTSSKLVKNKAQVETCYVKVEALIALLVGQVQEDVNRFHFHAHAHKFVLNSAILPAKTTKNCISSKDRESHQNHAFEQCKASNQQSFDLKPKT